ncbi:FAD/NAD(P)-binding domain-containing protein [Mytilinidion resinicola]|uniref:Kynurenine 3-monooxygenase n=1 Tax=Mytilinidion resinicola TaxID=574789 RepID=A0A6A6Z212_9PEZI|nr:FAD/NAD(P)-binding domain-containing protein [Mytilinidion resinicola]KAF2815141.1 FAD/NAD(P)-binding domain-containing protein [Mytilinidion resinicola]
MASPSGQKTVVVGAGPVGSLAALYAASRGDEVEVYELRGDLRDPSTTPLNFTKSINLALSERGINAMRHANSPTLLDAVFKETIPMYGRMIHGEKKGKLFDEAQLYDVHGRFQRAVDRGGLNKTLLDSLEDMPNVTLHFNHKLTGADFRRNLAWFSDHSASSPSEKEVHFDFMIGADGAHSAVRYHLMKYTRMAYSQEYIDTLWCEFQIPPSPTNTFALPPNYLHIWPGGSFMFIAIPSPDATFTSTLFLPASLFAALDAAPASLVPFFAANFPGVIPDLISEAALLAQYAQNPHLPLISIKCSPHHCAASAVILGDAAHAMVPFYGQGMNAGLEDVRVLFECLDAHPAAAYAGDATAARAAALEAYSAQRTVDAAAINDLALRNYREMSHDVVSPLYRLRKFVEESLDRWVPALGWATQYSRVSFGNMRYSEVEKATQRQGRIISRVVSLVVGGVVGLGVVSLLRRGPLWMARRGWNGAAMKLASVVMLPGALVRVMLGQGTLLFYPFPGRAR